MFTVVKDLLKTLYLISIKVLKLNQFLPREQLVLVVIQVAVVTAP